MSSKLSGALGRTASGRWGAVRPTVRRWGQLVMRKVASPSDPQRMLPLLFELLSGLVVAQTLRDFAALHMAMKWPS